MGETVELGEAGETGDMIQTGELGRVNQVIAELGVPGISAGELGEGGVSTGERDEGAVSTGERGEGAVSTVERGEGAVGTGEGAVSAGEGTNGVSEWWLVPAKRRNKRKSAMKDKGDSKTGRLVDAAAGTGTSDCESMSDCSELQEIDLYPPNLFKKFLTQTKGMKGLDLGTYFPDRLRFIWEPMVHGARLDVSAEATLRLTAALWRTQTLLFEHVVAVAGPDLTGVEAVGSLLGIRSTQAAEGVLWLWRIRLSTNERRLLEDYGQGTEPDSNDPFPEIRLAI
ncbi:hypothetical protein D4764_11G0002530 [Takifugu flavidus]|uniref:Uncharacterized protein n=1 Tax=Takifugu flavidus TaxID=433684 RepID=A0A5C6PEF8_9TELE|nr:hypothetical protein D4764_11G0002530 [Takifugu flavidus]